MKIIISIIFIFQLYCLQAKTITVGKTYTIKTLSNAIAIAKPSDTIKIKKELS